jgi:hypothetical protein
MEINLFVSLVLAGAVSIPSRTPRPAELESGQEGSAETKSEVAAGEHRSILRS